MWREFQCLSFWTFFQTNTHTQQKKNFKYIYLVLEKHISFYSIGIKRYRERERKQEGCEEESVLESL